MIGEFSNKVYPERCLQFAAVSALLSVCKESLSSIISCFNEEKRIDTQRMPVSTLSKVVQQKHCASTALAACQPYFTDETGVFIQGIQRQITYLSNIDDLDLILRQIDLLLGVNTKEESFNE